MLGLFCLIEVSDGDGTDSTRGSGELPLPPAPRVLRPRELPVSSLTTLHVEGNMAKIVRSRESKAEHNEHMTWALGLIKIILSMLINFRNQIVLCSHFR